MKNQNKLIIEYLQTGESLTTLEALEMFGCFRLSGRIFDIKKGGYNIRTKIIRTSSGKHIASYSLVKEPKQLQISI